MNEIDLYRNARTNSGDIIKMLPLAHDKDIDKFIKFMNNWAKLKVQHYLSDDSNLVCDNCHTRPLAWIDNGIKYLKCDCGKFKQTF